jgi:hypothetical protein
MNSEQLLTPEEEKALQKLALAIEASLGEFKLIFAQSDRIVKPGILSEASFSSSISSIPRSFCFFSHLLPPKDFGLCYLGLTQSFDLFF